MTSLFNRSTIGMFIVVLLFSGSAFSRNAEVIESGDDSFEQPNILFIWTDQQIFGMLSSEGNQHIQTPNLDRLAREGAMLNNAFCTVPSCSPSRATVVSGLFAHRHRLYDNIHPDKGLEGIKPMDGFKI
ncbi:MAG: sulfatase-like hydrolase/transferase, partial [Verrucomicrobiia bacterium]